MDNLPSWGVLSKTFLIPFFAALVFGVLGMGLSDFSFKTISASFYAGLDFVFVIFIFSFFMEPARGTTLVVLYAVAGISSAITWWQFAKPPWPVFIVAGAGGVLAVLWLYTDKSLRKGTV